MYILPSVETWKVYDMSMCNCEITKILNYYKVLEGKKVSYCGITYRYLAGSADNQYDVLHDWGV